MDYDGSLDEPKENEMNDNESDNQDKGDEILLEHEHNKGKMLSFAILGVALYIQCYIKYLMNQKVRTSICLGWQYVIKTLNTPGESYRMFIMEPDILLKLAKLVMNDYDLHPTRAMHVEEASAMFV